MRKTFFLIFLLYAGCMVSCSTSKNQYKNIEQRLYQRDFTSALAQIETAKEKEYDEKDKVLYYLDIGMLSHYSGKYKDSNDFLSKAEDAIEDLYTKSVSKMIGSGLMNDNVTDYAGADYEDIYINIFKALNYINLGDNEGAMVEARKVNIKLAKLKTKYAAIDENKRYKDLFHADALASYMSLLLYRADKAYDDAEIDKQQILKDFSTQPSVYNFPPPVLPATHPSAGKKGRLDIVAFTGLGPEKIAKTVNLTLLGGTATLVFAKGDERYRDIFGFTTLPIPGLKPSAAYNFKFEFPDLKPRKDRIIKTTLVIDGKETGQLLLLEDINTIAKVTFENALGVIISKTLIRAVLKYVAAIAAGEVARSQGGDLAGFLTGLGASAIMSATEQADLRMSFFFPAKAFVSEVELDPGPHLIEIRYYGATGLLYSDIRKVTVSQDGLNFIETYCF